MALESCEEADEVSFERRDDCREERMLSSELECEVAEGMVCVDG